MTEQDLEAAKILADKIHVNFPEDMDVFVERLRLYPQGCLVLAEEGRLVGYALTHPWRFGEPPPLNSRLGAIPRNATTYYLHDVALLPETRGRGHAARGVERLVDKARSEGFGNLSLVAVNRSQAFWERMGFRAVSHAGLETKLASYGVDAVLMVQDLGRTGD
ncbi:GNAT family N-acetyltransferase [Microvirga roseola]|uniref:GNAT family N-acetyltransferase n=1 Tax=Microvirga roseola TaxID=2883126 RepID=UPI001E3CD5B1|nr:GNAT family N-acetyltransferase [Microvirga roseola]